MNDMTKEYKKKYKKKSQIKEVWDRLKRNKTALLGLAIVIVLILIAVFAPLYYNYNEQVINQNVKERLQSPSSDHWFGTDPSGRDLFVRVMYGTNISLKIGFSAVALALIVGGVFGAFAGYYGGRIDNIIMRIMDVFLAIPGTLFAITIVAAIGSSIPNLIVALSISSIPRFSRIVRGSVMTVRDVEYIEAAKAIGANDRRIILQHVIPNALAPVMVQTTLNVATIILTVAGLSFIGLGVKSPMPEWGRLLSDSRNYLAQHPYLVIFPGLAIMITILSLNLLGDGLRDALDPRLK